MNQKKKNKIKRITKRRYQFLTRPISRYIGNKQVNMNDRYARYYDHLEIIPNSVLFEVRDGQSFTDSPYAMYRFMQNDARFENYTFYWVYSQNVELETIMRNLPQVKNTQFVLRNSDKYLRLLASVQYLITNSTFQSFFTKKEGQVYINTWHGTPLKTMGFDIPNNPFASQNVLRNFLMADYLISPNQHTTDMYLKSYKLNGLYDGEILESGYPRIDLTFSVPKAEIYAKLKIAGVDIDFDKKTILYTPTWKGSNLKNPTLDIEQMIAELNYIQERVSTSYNFLVKVHPFVYPFVQDREELSGILVPDYYDANEMMSITDILITDYSSIFFDFLATGKTILFYSWDKEIYSQDRGMYYKESELPGPTLSTVEEVVQCIQHLDVVKEQFSNQYLKMKELMVPYDDAHATERYIDEIFFGILHKEVHHPAICQDKYRIILFPSTLKDNGITTSAINLLNNIDYDKYDVTVIVQNNRNEVALKNINKINKNARIIVRFGWPIYKIEEVYVDQLLKNRSVTPELEKLYPKEAYQREMRRLTGGCHFNVSVDFSGYSYYWAKFMLEVNADRKVIYQHNDLHAEAKARYFIDLRGAFSLYKWYDVLLSVSPTTRDVNRAKLSNYAPEYKFQYCVNTIDTNRIFKHEHEEETLEENNFFLNDVHIPTHVLQDREYEFILDLTKPTHTKLEYIKKEDDLVAIMSGYYNHQKYFKILFQERYIGWLPAKYLENCNIVDDLKNHTQIHILSHNKEHQFAKIDVPSGHQIYKNLFDMEEGISKGSAKLLKDLNIIIIQVANVEKIKTISEFDEESEVETEKYYQFQVDGQTIGWINAKAVTITKEEVISDHNLRTLAKSLEQSWKVEGNYIIQSGKVYTSVLDIVVNRSTTLEIENSIFCAIWKLNIAGNNYYHGILENGQSIWISSNNIISAKNFKYQVKDVKECEYQAIFADEFPQIFMSLEDYYHYLSNDTLEDYKQHIAINNPITILSSMNINNKIVLKINWEGKEAFIEKQYVKEYVNEDTLTDIHGNEISFINSDNINFVTMGRLSNEKNQAALIRAISLLLEKDPSLKEKFRLYIMGDGPLKNQLLSLIKNLGLEQNVIMLGQKEHPFYIMKQCDCFILPSLYEGQPMVLLEALTLGMNTIASDIPSNRYVLENGKYGMLIDGTEATEIAETIQKYLTQEHHFAYFDYEQYNQNAIQNFYDEIR